MTEKRFTFMQDTLVKADVFDNDEFVCCTLSVWVEQLVDLLNELNDENKELLKYKYLTKALEEVSGSHYIEELISDFSDGSYCEDKDQIELGKWVVEHGLSWEDHE